jgi:hypothetical protein
VPLPFFEDFNTPDGSLPAKCWETAVGNLGASSVITNTSSFFWGSGLFGNTGTNVSSTFLIFSSLIDNWLVSPTIDLGNSVNKHIKVEFDIALTSFSSPVQGIFEPDDTVVLVISRDNGATWSYSNIIALFDSSNSPSAIGDHIEIDLTNESGLVKFAFMVSSPTQLAPTRVFFENFNVHDTVYAGVEELMNEGQFKVYPNPNEGMFTLANEGNPIKSNITMMDLQGRIVLNEQYFFGRNGSKQIVLKNVSSGVYILLLQSEGKQEQHRIIIK